MSYDSREMMLHMAVCKWMEILIGCVTWKGKVIDKRLEECKEKENLYFNVFETTLPQVLRTERVTIKAWIKEMGNVAQGTKAGRYREELGGDNTPASFWDTTAAVATAAGGAGPRNGLGLWSWVPAAEAKGQDHTSRQMAVRSRWADNSWRKLHQQQGLAELKPLGHLEFL